jgi:alpha-2-macroglobulin
MPALRSWSFRFALLTINVLGLLWIHHDLTAGPKLRLRVVSALPTSNVDETDRFTLVFDRPLPLSGTPGMVLTDSPFTIAPAVAGQWFWSMPERLEYRLEKPLPAGRRFTIKAASTFERLTGQPLSGPAEFKFQTRALQLTACNVASSDNEHSNIELEFNQPVDPSELTRRLRVTDTARSRTVRVQVLSHAPAEKLTVRLPLTSSEHLLLAIDGELKGSGAEVPLGEEVRRELDLRPNFAIVKAEVEAAGLEANTCVNIRFSRPLEHAKPEVTPAVTVAPPLSHVEVSADYDGGNVSLSGPFESSKRYTATFGPELRNADKQTLGSEQSISFDIPDRKPALHFAMKSGVLSPGGNLLMDLKVVNVPTLRLRASRVHTNNLAAHLRGDRRNKTSREMPEKSVSVETPRNVPTTVAVDLRGALKAAGSDSRAPLGVYWVEAIGPDGAWIDESAIVAVTDLALTSKAERDGFCVWVTSLRTAKPVAGAEVGALSYNGQVLATAQTDAHGLAHLAVSPGHPDGKAWVLTAKLGDDLSFLQPDERPWALEGVDRSGRPIPTSYDAMLYTDRGVYRPGESIHITGIIRDAAGATPPSFPLSISVHRPDGKEVAQLPVKPEAQGIFHVDYPTLEQARTGPYNFRLSLPGSQDALGQAEALVEEYVPQRMEVKADASKPRFGPNDDVTVNLAARYLFDQAAAGLAVKVEGAYQRAPFTSKRFPTFRFDADGGAAEQKIKEQELKLDDAGRASVQIERPPLEGSAPWRADLVATVTEEGGHSISRHVDLLVDRRDRHVGLRLPGGSLAAVGSEVTVEWVQLTGADALADRGPTSYTLSRVDQDTTLQEVDGRLVWKTVEQVTKIAEGELAAPTATAPAAATTAPATAPSASSQPASQPGQDNHPAEIGQFRITAPGPGLYRLALTDCYSGAIGQVEFHAAQEQDETYASALNHPEQLDIALDKESYVPGSTARVLVKSPFPGTLLVTLETDRVIESRVVELATASAELEMPVSATLRGGAFVTATVVRRVDPSDRNWLPHRALGMVRLRTDLSGHALPVRIIAPPQTRPEQSIRVRVETTPPADPQHPTMVHLWAVDEGILLATSYKTPHPGEHFFADREAGVNSADIFGDLLPDQQRPAGMTRIGGDGGDEDYGRRLSSAPGPRRSLMVIWRKAAPVGSDGSLTVDMDIPEFTGAVRLMAVAVVADGYGSAQAIVPVSAPLLVEASWPRFAAPDDRFEVPAKLFNTTGEPLVATVSVVVDGPLQVEVQQPAGGTRINPGTPATVWLRARATGIGPLTAKVRATATSPAGESLVCTQGASFGVRPAGPLHAESRLVCVKAGESLKIAPDPQFLPGTTLTTVAISGQPAVHLRPAVEELLNYPYGCVEQTTSQLYVLLYAPELLRDEPGSAETKPAGPTGRGAVASGMLEAGIGRLWSMQTHSGGLSYWPGESEPMLWGSAYAAEFLARAKAAGQKVDATFISELVKYLQSELDHPSGEEMDANVRAQVCYVLSALHKPPQGWMARLSEQPDKLDMGGRAHLAAAWLAGGRKDRALAVLAEDTLAQTVATTTGGRLTSAVQQEAALLNTLLDLDRNHVWIPALVQRLEKARSSGHWGSTLENASALAALVRYQLASTKETPHFEGSLRQAASTWSFDAAKVHTFKTAGDGPLELTSTGQGNVFLSLTTQGLLRDAQKTEYDRQIKVARHWTDRGGKPIDPAKIKVGDLVQVETTIVVAADDGESGFENIAIVDALPGGMEVENPRLSNADAPADAADAKQEETPDRVEFRDDRVVLFASAGHQKLTLRYALRAITAGSFVLPPIQASCMYDAGVASVHGGGRVEIGR